MRRFGAGAVAAGLITVAAAGVSCSSTSAPVPSATTLDRGLVETFDGPDGLITNEYATYNPGRADAARSLTWIITSGSLFRRASAAWTGSLTPGTPDARSSHATNSAVFRMVSARDTFENLTFTVRFRVEHQTDLDPHEWDGIHLFLKYRDETELYYVTVARRDGIAAIKRKVTGGASNGGTYETLAQTAGGAVIRPGQWVTAQGRIATTPDGVLIEMALDGQALVAAIDRANSASC